jgi:hypothetical protein
VNGENPNNKQMSDTFHLTLTAGRIAFDRQAGDLHFSVVFFDSSFSNAIRKPDTVPPSMSDPFNDVLDLNRVEHRFDRLSKEKTSPRFHRLPFK